MEEKKRNNKNHQNDENHENFESDDNIRRMLLWSLEESCGECERELNQDPKMKDIKPPDDLLERIIKELKDRGEWDKDPADDDPAIYNMLSDEEREFLTLGKKVRKINKRTVLLKRMAIAACVGICIFGVTMTSEANRQYVVGLWNEIVGNSKLRITMNVEEQTDDKDKIQTEAGDVLEYEAMEQIREELGIQPLEMVYKPEGMEFSSVRIEKNDEKASLFYEYRDTLFIVTMQKEKADSKYTQEFDGIVVGETSVRGITDKIDIWKINDDIEETYAAQLEGKEVCYVVRGSVEKKEFEKIIKEIIIFN